MNNKRVLQKATKELDKAKAPVKKKDIIVDPMGQWKYPGQVTRIPSDTITMEGVDYPVLGVPDNGQPVMMQPGAYYDFPGANYVDEYPQMKKGGGLKTKKYTRSIEGTNYLFAESDLFKKPKKLSKKRIFHPNAKYYAEGGALLTKKVTCKKCGWEWDAADGGDDITTCHKCGGQGLVHVPNGGAPIPKGYQAALSQYVNPVVNETDEHTGYNAATGEVNRDTRPGSIENNDWWTEHEKFHHLQNQAGAMSSSGPAAQRPNYTTASDQAMGSYYNRSNNEVQAQIDKMIAENPDLQFIPREKLIQSIFPVEGEQPSFVGAGDLIYADPSTVEGEARVYEQYIRQGGKSVFPEKKNGGEYIQLDLTPEEIQEYAKGGFIVEDVLDHMAEGGEACPEGYTWDENTKACLPDEIIWAKDENDPIYQDYLIKKGLYDYSNYPNYSLREDANFDLAEAARKGDLSKIKNFSNAEYYKGLIEDAQAHYNYQKERGAIDEETLQEYENKVLNANRSFYGSPETYTQIPNDQLKSDPNIKDPQANGMFQDQKIDSFLAKYPPVQWTKKSRYTSIPFTPRYGWTGEDYGSSNYWTTPNTLFIEDNIDRKALKKIYPNMPDEFIDKYIAQQRKEPSYISNNYLPQYGSYDSPTLYDNNGDYSLKTPTKTYTDKKGIKGYIQEEVGDDIHKYYRYLPSWNKPEKTVMFMPPPMDIMPPGKIEQPKGKLVGTAEKILAPEYTTPNYKMDVPSYYKAHHNSSQLIPHARLRRSETDARVTRPFAKLTQKVTGYNPQAMEGYEDEEGNWIPGEIEQAQQEGRKIEFQGLGNLQDRAAQEKYNTEYDKYLMATKYPQMIVNGMLNRQTSTDLTKNKRQEGGASGCPPGFIKVNGKCVSLDKKATAQDSLAVYNNAVALQKFYKSNNYKATPLSLPVQAWEDVERARQHVAEQRINSQNIYGKKVHLNDYYKKLDDYKFKQRDLPLPETVTSLRNGQGFIIGNGSGNNKGLGLINTDAPMALYDARIKPNSFTRYDHQGDMEAYRRYLEFGKLKDFKKGHIDAAGVFSYDPISVKPSRLLTDKEVKERFKKYGPSGISQSRLEQLKLVPTKSNPKPPGKTSQGDYTESSTLDPKTGKVVTIKEPIYEDRLPIREPERGSLQPFVKINYPPGPPPYHGVEPNIQGNEVPMYATPDSGAEFVPQTERYIDWDGNSIGFNGVRFRKPGHGGDLIKKGRKHYIHYPSIETRHSADIVPEEEEFGMGGITKYPNGGESKPRKVRREVKPFTTSNLKEYQKRKQAYDDSLTLYKAGLEEYDLTTKTKGLIDSPLYEPEAYDAYKRLGYPKGYNVNMKRSDNTNTRGVMYEKPVQPVNKKTKPVPKKSKPVPKKSQQVKPFVTSDPKEYALRKAAYDDSLSLFNLTNAQQKIASVNKDFESMTPQQKKDYYYINQSNHWQPGTTGLNPRFFGKDEGSSRIVKVKGNITRNNLNSADTDYYHPTIKPHRHYTNPHSITENFLYKKPVQQVIFKEEIKEDPTVKPIIPIEQPQPPVQDNYPPGPPPFNGVEPFIQGDPIPEYATPDRDAQWVAQKERYIDWNGNNISYKLPRFRKPGHSGPLVKGSRTHYLHYPSIETRNSADIIPEEEEFAMGGEYNLGDEIELTEAEVRRLKSLGYIIEEL